MGSPLTQAYRITVTSAGKFGEPLPAATEVLMTNLPEDLRFR
jgi:hypothetical protein